MEYSRPEVSSLGGEVEPQSTWYHNETYATNVFVGWVAALVILLVSVVDVTP